MSLGSIMRTAGRQGGLLAAVGLAQLVTCQFSRNPLTGSLGGPQLAKTRAEKARG